MVGSEPLKNISTLVFDLDGTVSDSSLGIYRCLNHALRNHGYSEVTEQRVLAEIGPPLEEIFCRLIPAADQVNVNDLVSTYRERYAEVGYAENRLYPGIAEALAELVGRGMRLGICTSKRKDFAEQILAMFGVLGHFDFVSGGDVGIKKRDQLAELLGDARLDHQAVMIGDRGVDIVSARANGLRSVGVLWGYGDRRELTEAGADLLLDSPAGLSGLAC